MTNRRFCKLQCPETHNFGVNNKNNFVKIACKCARVKGGGRDCAWYHRRKKADYAQYACNAKPTPAPETTVAPSGTTVAPSGTTVAPSGTTAAPSGTTVAPSGTTVAPSGTTVAPSGTA